MQKRKLVYVSCNPSESLCARLEERGWRVEVAAGASEVRRSLRQDVTTGALLDVSSGFVTRELAALEASLMLAHVGWVAMTTQAHHEDVAVRRIIREYCFDYVTVPTSDARIVDSVGHAYGMAALNGLSDDSREDWPESGMLGSCDAMRALFLAIRKVAMNDAPVFIAGESGTGKELTAFAIHSRSRRRDKPFVAVNCAAIPTELFQSELFGYEKGAFTGANQLKIGKIESAHGGTLFLDEIGDLPLESQANLLRFLQEGHIERLGGHSPTKVDVRIVSATHVDINAAMREGQFRPDLYYRLCVLQLDEPPLRARGKDIEVLSKCMFDRFRSEAERRLRGFSPDAIAAMYNYGWPGNVRELMNRIRRAIVLSEGGEITADDLEIGAFAELAPVTMAQARAIAERQAIELAMLRHRERLNEAANDLGISRGTLSRLLRVHGMLHADIGAEVEESPEEASSVSAAR